MNITGQLLNLIFLYPGKKSEKQDFGKVWLISNDRINVFWNIFFLTHYISEA